MQKKGILFIGGCGFIGSNLVRKFFRSGKYNIIVFEAPGASETRLQTISNSIQIIYGNLGDIHLINSIVEQYKIHTIVHLVSCLLPNSSIEDYQKELNNVVVPTIGLIHMCAEKGIRFIYFSSGGVIYGNNNIVRHKENEDVAPISYYGLSKCNIEDVIKIENRRNALSYLILRPSNPYGRGQNLYGRQGLIAVAIGKILKGESIELYGETTRDYIYIEDLAAYVFNLIDGKAPDGTYNIGSGKGYTNTEVLAIIEKVSSRKIDIIHKKTRTGDVQKVVLNIMKLRDVAKIKTTNLEEGIRLFWEENKD